MRRAAVGSSAVRGWATDLATCLIAEEHGAAEGTRAAVGDVETCIYEKGRLRKRMTERIEARRLAFEVIEQEIHFERDLTLLGGSFDLEPRNGGGTRLTLTTRYRPLSDPGWVWRPLERWVHHTLHDHGAGAIDRRPQGTLHAREVR